MGTAVGCSTRRDEAGINEVGRDFHDGEVIETKLIDRRVSRRRHMSVVVRQVCVRDSKWSLTEPRRKDAPNND